MVNLYSLGAGYEMRIRIKALQEARFFARGKRLETRGMLRDWH